MKLNDYIIKCVDNYVAMSKGEKHNLRVFIDCREKFIQIGGVIYIPNSHDAPFDGVFIRTSDAVGGWEDIEESELHIQYVEEIVIRR